jgi:hypothetical protein
MKQIASDVAADVVWHLNSFMQIYPRAMLCTPDVMDIVNIASLWEVDSSSFARWRWKEGCIKSRRCRGRDDSESTASLAAFDLVGVDDHDEDLKGSHLFHLITEAQCY